MANEGEVIINKDITVEVESKSIILLLLQVLSSDNKINTVNFELSNEVTDILYKLIYYSPDFFNEIDKIINEVIKDNKIDSNDIPNLILLIKKLYDLIYRLKDVKLDLVKRAEICGDILKFTVRFLIEERKINISNENKQSILELMDKLIDSCVGLIQISTNIRNGTCFSYIKTLFCCK